MSQPSRAPFRFWADLTTADFANIDLAKVIAVLPLGATEQHGPHLPLSVDSDLAEGVIQAALSHMPDDLQVLFLPVQTVGFSPEHQTFAGTLTLSAETVIRLWTELGESLARSGIRKLVLFNAHGGHVGLMDVVARDLRARLNMLVYSVSWFNLPMGEAEKLIAIEERRYGVHAGQLETAMMMAIKPGSVRAAQLLHFSSAAQERAGAFPILGNGKSAKLAWQMQDYNRAGAAGNAAAASAEQGKALLAAAGLGLAQLLAEIDRLPPEVLSHPYKA